MINPSRNPEENPLMTAVDYCNHVMTMRNIFETAPNCCMLSDEEASDDLDPNFPVFSLLPNGLIEIKNPNHFDIPTGLLITKFMAYATVWHSKNVYAAMADITYNRMNIKPPYIRVGIDYYKVFQKPDQFGAQQITLKAWSKEIIRSDYGKATDMINKIPKYDDFTIVPDNINYRRNVGNLYNEYMPFPHTPAKEDIKASDIPHSIHLMKHIFGEHLQLGMIKYMKILYEYPKQMLPVLVLVSEERQTGKTTFLNWIQMLFGNNSVLINPSALTDNHNTAYATKNIIMIDETVIEKSAGVEKLKSLATAKSVSINPKHVTPYSLPFYGKIIMCTNKVRDFMRIDQQEIRFWVRKISPIPDNVLNTEIEKDLFKEIPKFLKFLLQLDKPDFSKSRMILTYDEIRTSELDEVKSESRSGLAKDIETNVQSYFDEFGKEELQLSATDIKNHWFKGNTQVPIHYIIKTLKNELNMSVSKPIYYPAPFRDSDFVKQTQKGRVYTFINPDFVKQDLSDSEMPM